MPADVATSIHETLQALARGLHSILDDRLVALYLGGSLVLDDFCEVSSDLDFLVVTHGGLSLEDAVALEQLHNEILAAFPLAARLEGDYAPLDLLIPEGTAAPVPGCESGRFLPRVGEVMLSADNIYNLREQGVTIFGPHPKEVLPAVSTEQVRAAVRGMLADGPGVCASPEEAAQELLNLVRSASAIESGLPTSKSSGAAWAMTELDDCWRPAVRAALALRKRQGSQADAQLVVEALPSLNQLLRDRYVPQNGRVC